MRTRAELEIILDALIGAARSAGSLVMPLFQGGCASKNKADGSIVTIADTQAEALITARLKEQFPHVAFLGEESDAAGKTMDLGEAYFCVDPIDGTKQFASGLSHWVVSIAYVEAGRPLAGVIYAPAVQERLFAGLSDFGGFELLPDCTKKPFQRPSPARPIWQVLRGGHDTVEAVTSHLPKDQEVEITTMSSAIKFGLIAVGEADVFVRAGQVWDWDIAAGQALVEAAGGKVFDIYGQPLKYGQTEKRFRHPPFICHGSGVAFLRR